MENERIPPISEPSIKLQREAKLTVTRFQSLTVAKLSAFLSVVPSDAVIEVNKDKGGGTQLDPGGTFYIKAEWTEDL